MTTHSEATVGAAVEDVVRDILTESMGRPLTDDEYVRWLDRQPKRQLVAMVKRWADHRGRRWIIGGPERWSKDELVSALMRIRRGGEA